MTTRATSAAIAAKTGELGAMYYFHPDTIARGKELGLDGMRFYLLGRGGVLGDVDATVVRSAFGYFAPGTVEKLWNSAREVIAPRQAAVEHLACNAALGRAVLTGVDGLEAYNSAASTVIAAVDESGLTLFAGFRAATAPDDTPARALHHAVVLRELRGSAHLAAVRAAGLDSRVAHAIKRPDMVEMFGWSEPIEITQADIDALERAEAITDQILQSAFGALDDAGAAALIAGTDAMYAAFKAPA